MLMKGAPEVVLSMCSYIQSGDNREKIPEDFNVKLNETIQRFTSNGLVRNVTQIIVNSTFQHLENFGFCLFTQHNRSKNFTRTSRKE